MHCPGYSRVADFIGARSVCGAPAAARSTNQETPRIEGHRSPLHALPVVRELLRLALRTQTAPFAPCDLLSARVLLEFAILRRGANRHANPFKNLSQFCNLPGPWRESQRAFAGMCGVSAVRK